MPEMRQQEAGAAVDSRVRYHVEEELGSREFSTTLVIHEKPDDHIAPLAVLSPAKKSLRRTTDK